MKTIHLVCIFLFLTTYSLSQCDTNRYFSPIFQSVYKHSNVKYGEAPVWYIPYSNQDLLMDVYEPLGDDNLKRPLMIWVHPGGFLLGDKEAEDMVALCDSFARRGYVTASVGYRLGFNPVDSESAERAVYRGTQDIRAAIRYLKEYASIFRIDTTSIFLGGSSAGGVATLHVAYLDQEEAPPAVYGDSNLVPNLLSIDNSGNYYNHTVELKGIINMWGALGDSTFIDSDETTPALLIHGTEDAVVPFGVGNPFGVFTTPIVHGSRCISNQLTSLNIPHSTLFFEGQDHEPHGTSNGYWEDTIPTPYWDTIFNQINAFYYSLLRPKTQQIFGDTIVCSNQVVNYTLNNETGILKTCWTVEGGEILAESDSSIQILWQNSGSISFTQFTESNAASTEKTIQIQVNPIPDATFTYSNIDSSFTFTPNQSGLNYSWNFNSLGTSNEENPTIYITENNLYPIQLNVTNEFNCSAIFESEILFLSADVLDLNNNGFEIYPNPFHEFLQIKVPSNQFNFTISDLKGKVILEGTNMEFINVEGMQKGTYIIKVTSNSHVGIYKLIKE